MAFAKKKPVNERMFFYMAYTKNMLILPAVKSERVYLDPSCGLGDYLPREIAFKKLQNIVSIAEKARELI